MNTTRRPLAAALLSAALAAAAPSAMATVVVDGTLFATASPTAATANTVDFWSVHVNTGGVVSFDLLSWENQPGGQDVNGDGEYRFFDTQIWLFNGAPLAVNLIAANDDSSATLGDGSISTLDSFLSLNLAAGDYTLLVAACCVAHPSSLLDGVQDINALRDGAFNTGADHGDYRLTVNGDVTVNGLSGNVPLPGTLALAGLGLAGLARARRR